MRRWALIAAAVLYSSWILGPWLDPAVGAVSGYASEYAAPTQPHHLFFQLCDVACGLLCALVGTVSALRSTGSLVRWGWWGLALFGVSTMVDGGVTTMGCSPTADPACDPDAGSWLHALHGLSSSAAVLGIAVAAACLTAAAAGRARWTGGVLCGTLLLTTAIAGFTDTVPGVWQRIQLVAIAAVLGWAAFLRLPDRRHPVTG
ncbi:DUF998 domain-containing protein [Hamadaea tsunoensis]|uniref:DUF998 domain-containing protein n=1 Tax=Hamadaea tsunoensis TaxID=53368 RepID=UPI00042178AD|nr:DUF998 domain-containing protein [Hamadaea tsunoensis]